MRKFDYRVPRFAVGLPIRLTFDDSTQMGLCTEISTEGMTLEVFKPLSADSLGRVHVDFNDVELDLAVCVAHSGSSCDGVRFVYQSEEQRNEVSRLIAVITTDHRGTGPALLR